jgi:Asp-tRNA(Asn)/Glu-tRNA(Gln) amidotransferase A subunit family amidase
MDVDFSSAIERARELDELFKRTKTLVGPLHGLPVSIKVCINDAFS